MRSPPDITPGKRQETEQGHVLIISHDVVGDQMAGPGIRYHHLARVLAREFPVLLAVPEPSRPAPSTSFAVLIYDSADHASLVKAVGQARAVLIPAVLVGNFPFLAESPIPLIIDGYDPFVAETLAFQALQNDKQAGDAIYNSLLPNLTQAYNRGDFFVCASERQRDWWLGLLEANGRVNRYTFQEDSSLRRLLDVVPFGLPETQPQHTRPVIKGVRPGLRKEDKIILWGGGLWPWLDPLTVIRAVARVCQQRQDVRLVFPGIRHPNPEVARIPTHAEEAIRLARETGLLDKAIFFGDWVPYTDWPNILVESDLAITLHCDTLETRLAFRSRVLDYVWAGLPIIATEGDATSELVKKHKLGRVVGYKDVEGVTEAIFELLEIPGDALNERFEEARQVLTWERAARPLMAFCRQPRLAADRVALGKAIGNPFYNNQVKELRSLVGGYEQGRFIRLMRFIRQVLPARNVRRG